MEDTNSRPEGTTPIRPPRVRDGGPGEDSSLNSTSMFNQLVQSAFSATATAQSIDASSGVNKEAAFKEYDHALQLIDKAISYSSTLSFSEDSHQATLVLQLRCTRKEILERVSDLQHQSSSGSGGARQGVVEEREPGLPPAYGDVVVSPGVNRYDPQALAAALEEIAREDESDWTRAGPLPLNAREVYSLPGEVQIYFISAEDNVSAPSYPSFLRLVTMEPEPAIGERRGGDEGVAVVAASVPAFLQVGDWTYPLIPRHSPVFRSTEGIYIFPDLSSNAQGSYVGLILPESVDADGRRAFEGHLLALVGVDRFPPVLPPPSSAEEAVLHPSLSTAREKPPRPPAPLTSTTFQQPPEEVEGESGVIVEQRVWSTKIAEGLITGAEAMSRGLIAGASKTTALLDRGATYINSRIEPAREKPVVKPEVKAGMKTAKSVTGKAVQLSGFIVSQVGKGTIALGRHMAPHVHKASTKFLARTVATDEADATMKVDQMLEVTTGAVVGFGTVYFGLEHAGRALVASLANNSVRIVQHKYGDEVGECTADAAACAGNAALTAWNTKNLAPKAVAKRVAKDTGRMVVKAHQAKGAAATNINKGEGGHNNQQPPGTGGGVGGGEKNGNVS